MLHLDQIQIFEDCNVAKIWDGLMKMLVGANPQHLVSLLLPGAHFEKELVTEMRNRTQAIMNG